MSLATISKWVNQFQQNKEILKERKKRKDFELNKFKKPLEREKYLLKKENERIKAENEVLKKLVALPKIKTKTNIRKQIAFIKSELQVSKITLSWYLKELRISYDTWNKYSKNCDEYQPNIDYSIYEIIKAIHRENSIKGHRQIKLSLEEQKINVSNSTVYRYMKLANRISSVRIKTRKKNNHFLKMTNEHIRHKYLLKRNFKAEKNNQKWSIDITYVKTITEWVYLFAIKDLFSNLIVNYSLTTTPTVNWVNNCIKEAIIKRKIIKGELTINSDQGIHFTSKAYEKLLKKHGINISMSRRGNCLDNSPIENLFSILKTENSELSHCKNILEVKNIVDNYIIHYNEKRKILNLKMPPLQYEMKAFFN
ncbi:IS3 family transposase [Spiroplasma endosymbiont of Polydrusus pterygomalis]|uniref:IS3 family transposase n=1 Tax=Spiroplasma endosymbiont of Polydrusus pterygomalis TaxID=3139327 RepID=UPI003CCAA3D7